MASVWESVVDNYKYIFTELGHPLTKDWLLVPSPFPLLTILVAYNVFCTIVGPAYMKNRPPYKLNLILKLYNIFQVLISLYIFYEGWIYMFSGDFNFKCQGVRDGEVRIAKGIQVYLMTKLIELLDTVFFVLRKSDRQITFLHLYHHTLMPCISWFGLKYFPGGQGIILGAINSLVHVVMYTYYFISGLGPEYQKYLWWKKYLTVMQIVQFLIVLLHSVNSLFYSCSFLPILKVMTILFAGIFVHLFSKFYYVTYIAKRTSNKNGKIQNTVTNKKHNNGNESNVNSVGDRKYIANGASNDDSSKNEVGNKKYTNGTSNGTCNGNDKQLNGTEKNKSV